MKLTFGIKGSPKEGRSAPIERGKSTSDFGVLSSARVLAHAAAGIYDENHYRTIKPSFYERLNDGVDG